MKATLAGASLRNSSFGDVEEEKEITLDDIKEGIIGAFTEMFAAMKKEEERERQRKERAEARKEMEARRLAKEELRNTSSKRR